MTKSSPDSSEDSHIIWGPSAWAEFMFLFCLYIPENLKIKCYLGPWKHVFVCSSPRQHFLINPNLSILYPISSSDVTNLSAPFYKVKPLGSFCLPDSWCYVTQWRSHVPEVCVTLGLGIKFAVTWVSSHWDQKCDVSISSLGLLYLCHFSIPQNMP